jgi:hypothetical protein
VTTSRRGKGDEQLGGLRKQQPSEQEDQPGEKNQDTVPKGPPDVVAQEALEDERLVLGDAVADEARLASTAVTSDQKRALAARTDQQVDEEGALRLAADQNLVGSLPDLTRSDVAAERDGVGAAIDPSRFSRSLPAAGCSLYHEQPPRGPQRSIAGRGPG